jgi:hypothetical protein
VHHTAVSPKLMRALRRGGLQADSAMIVGNFIDGGERSEGGREEESWSSALVAGGEESKRGQQQ